MVLSQVETMTPKLLRKIKELVADGATVVGAPPVKSPSLSGYPQCDDEVRKLAAELWGDCDGKTITEHVFGQGRGYVSHVNRWADAVIGGDIIDALLYGAAAVRVAPASFAGAAPTIASPGCASDVATRTAA
jgi:hypothetical protein